MYDGNIKTSVNLVNTTIHNVSTNGEAGKVGLIGSFPSMINTVQEHTNLRDLRTTYGITAGTYKETEFEGARDARRIFMEGFSGYRGASSILSVNTCDVTSENKLNLTALENSVNVTVSKGTVNNDETKDEKIQDAMKMTYDRLKEALNKISDDDIDILYIANDLREATDDNHTLLDVYRLIIDFLNDEFSTTRPTYFVGSVQTDGASDTASQPSGLGSQEINVLGTTKTENDETVLVDVGAKQICELFADNNVNNELTVAALFYQGGIILDEKVGPGEMAAHMCGWISSLPVYQDLTYLTIPGVTGISEEVYFGENDAGYNLNQMGVNVIKPKSRKDKTFYVNNSITPTGWHLNQIRAVAYLLKRYAFEAGLGINNLSTQLETFKANLNTVTYEVIKETNEFITEVTFDEDIIIHNHDHIELALNITVGGVVTKIDVGVNMSLEDYSTVTTTN